MNAVADWLRTKLPLFYVRVWSLIVAGEGVQDIDDKVFLDTLLNFLKIFVPPPTLPKTLTNPLPVRLCMIIVSLAVVTFIFIFILYSLNTVTPSAKAAFQGAVTKT